MTENYSRSMSLADVLAIPVCSYLIEEAPLSTVILRACRSMHLEYIGEIIERTEYEFMQESGFGRTKLNELKSFLTKYGLILNTNIKDNSETGGRHELRALQEERDKTLPELQQNAGPRCYWRPDFNEENFYKGWHEAAHRLLTPEHVQRLENERQREVIMSRLFDVPTPTLKQLGMKYDLSVEYIRGVENVAHSNIRRMIRADVFPAGGVS